MKFENIVWGARLRCMRGVHAHLNSDYYHYLGSNIHKKTTEEYVGIIRE